MLVNNFVKVLQGKTKNEKGDETGLFDGRQVNKFKFVNNFKLGRWSFNLHRNEHSTVIPVPLAQLSCIMTTGSAS